MQKIRFDKARKQLIIDGERINAVELDYFVQQNTFDKHLSKYINHKGLTYVIENPKNEEEDEIFFPINLQYQDTDLQSRLFAGKSAEEIEAINEIKKDYGYSK